MADYLPKPRKLRVSVWTDEEEKVGGEETDGRTDRQEGEKDRDRYIDRLVGLRV